MICALQPVRLAIDRNTLLRYAELSNDYNPIHVDPEFAASTPLGGIIAHGTLSLNLLLEAIERTFGRPTDSAHELDIRFRAPVREGDLVEAGGAQRADGDFDVWVRNQHGEAVIEGIATIDMTAIEP